MCRSKYKKRIKLFEKEEEITEESGHVYADNVRKVKLLVEMSTDESVHAELKKLSDLIYNSTPSRSKTALKLDKQIGNDLDDVKLLIVKNKEADRILENIKELRNVVIDRNNVVGQV